MISAARSREIVVHDVNGCLETSRKESGRWRTGGRFVWELEIFGSFYNMEFDIVPIRLRVQNQ